MNDLLYTKILPAAGWALVNGLTVSLKIGSVGEETVEKLRRKGQPLVYAFWHGRHFLLIRYMAHRNIAIMASTSRDGQLLAGILRRQGYGIIPGSSSRSPMRAVIGSMQKIQAGYDVAIAVDGPTGPALQSKPGALYVAKKTGAVIVPVSTALRPHFTLRSWDRYQIPKPGARALMMFGSPWFPSPSLDEQVIQEESALLDSKLNELGALGDRMLRQETQ